MSKNFTKLNEVTPFFFKGEAGLLFAVYYPPVEGVVAENFVLHVPAFAEEMNKSRRMMALQARKLSKCGYAVLIVDLFGTGDSEGVLEEASWDLWKVDLINICQYIIDHGANCLQLWGLRTGALLAMEIASESNFNFQKLIMWQPVLNMETFIMQFLRLRIASSIMKKGSLPEKTSDLKKQILDGKQIEVAGYMLSPDLILPLLKLSSAVIKNTPFEEIFLFEITSDIDKGLSPAYVKYKDEMLKKNTIINTKVLKGNAFWSSQEISETPELLNETNRCFI